MDDIRNLIMQVQIAPQVGTKKVYIIDEVHMLSQAAFNAFLKTLEEPPSYAIFILATTEKHKILPTILSRCQVFDFRRITVSEPALAGPPGHRSYAQLLVAVRAFPLVEHRRESSCRRQRSCREFRLLKRILPRSGCRRSPANPPPSL